jgi:hypothetical protein
LSDAFRPIVSSTSGRRLNVMAMVLRALIVVSGGAVRLLAS